MFGIRKTLGMLAVLGMVVSGHAALAASSECPQFFAGGQAPNILNPKMVNGNIALCNTGYATLYSGVVLDPLYSADVLTSEGVREGHGAGRHGSFHVDSRLPYNMQVTPNDFKARDHRMFDRGHMVPNGDMYTASLQEETFLMSNMIPQDADNNEGLHEGIEVATRNLAEQTGNIYVVTGPVFYGSTIERLNGKSFIPTMIYKAIYIPNVGAGVYIEDNSAGSDYSVISVDQLTSLIGMDVFPGISSEFKSQALRLPVPTPTFKGGTRESRAAGRNFGPPQMVSLEQLIEVIRPAGGYAGRSGQIYLDDVNTSSTHSEKHPILKSIFKHFMRNY